MTDKTIAHPFAIEAANPDTPPQRLVALSHDHALMPIIAANPATPSTTLELLGKEQNASIQSALAQNPNTPMPLLLQLAPNFPGEFLSNPVLPLLNLAQPDFIKDIPPSAWLPLLRYETIPIIWLNMLRQDFIRLYGDQQNIKKAVLSHVSVAGEHGKHWTHPEPETKDTSLLNHIARHPRTPPNILASLITEAPSTRQAIANNPSIPISLLRQLVSDESISVRRAVALHRATLLEDLETLALDLEVPVRAAVAHHPQLSTNLYGLLAGDACPKVRAALACNTHAPEYILTALTYDLDYLVRCEVAKNPRLPKDSFSVLFHDTTTVVHYNLAQNAQLPHGMFIQLAELSELSMHEYLAANSRAPLALLDMLIQDKDMDVWNNIARNPQASPDLLNYLAKNGTDLVCAAVAANKKTPVKTLRWLMQNRNKPMLQVKLLANPHTPIDMLENILLSDHSALCFRAVYHPTILQQHSGVLLNSLLTNIKEGTSSSENRLSPLKHTVLPVPILTAFASSPFGVERCFVALHPKTPRSLLQALTHDGNRYVRALARVMLEKRGAQSNTKEAL